MWCVSTRGLVAGLRKTRSTVSRPGPSSTSLHHRLAGLAGYGAGLDRDQSVRLDPRLMRLLAGPGKPWLELAAAALTCLVTRILGKHHHVLLLFLISQPKLHHQNVEIEDIPNYCYQILKSPPEPGPPVSQLCFGSCPASSLTVAWRSLRRSCCAVCCQDPTCSDCRCLCGAAGPIRGGYHRLVLLTELEPGCLPRSLYTRCTRTVALLLSVTQAGNPAGGAAAAAPADGDRAAAAGRTGPRPGRERHPRTGPAQHQHRHPLRLHRLQIGAGQRRPRPTLAPHQGSQGRGGRSRG